MHIHDMLEQVRAGAMSVDAAEQFLRREPFEEMDYAKIDTHRELRSGFSEVIFCAGKEIGRAHV